MSTATSPAPVSPATTATPVTLTHETVRASFRGQIQPVKISARYQAALAIAAITMLVLPLLYGALIIAVGCLIYLWAIHGVEIFSHSISLWTGLAYLTPLVAGATLVLFMIKPLFASPAKTRAPLELDLAQEPALRAFLEEICTRVGVAFPQRVSLDCQVNASASFRRGWRSLGQGDLVLTIGLPLVRGLTAQQLAGVVAHEFGHFAQRTSMAFTYIIRQVSHWFARVVFERDSWDEALENNARDADWRIAAMLHTARSAVWVSRQILHGLMVVGQAISSLLMRQMEYDADAYDVQVGGSDAFAFTSRELRYLSLADQQADRDLQALWRDHRLVRDYPRLVTLRRAQINQEFSTKFDADIAQQKSGWLHTHPSEPERINRARRAALPGVFKCDAPATALFSDYDATELAATEHFYRTALGDHAPKAELVAAETVSATVERDTAADAAWQEISRGLVTLDPPFVVTLADLAADRYPDASKTIREVRTWIATHEARLRAALEGDNKLHRQCMDALSAQALVKAGIKINAVDFGVAESTVAAADKAVQSAQAARQPQLATLGELNTQLRRWLGASVQFAGEQQAELRQLAESFASLSPLFSALPDWVVRIRILQTFAANADKFPAAGQRFRELRDLASDDAERWIQTARGIRYPFAHAEGELTVPAYLKQSFQPGEGAFTAISYFQSAASLYFRLLGRLALLSAQALRADAELPPTATTPSHASATPVLG